MMYVNKTCRDNKGRGCGKILLISSFHRAGVDDE